MLNIELIRVSAFVVFRSFISVLFPFNFRRFRFGDELVGHQRSVCLLSTLSCAQPPPILENDNMSNYFRQIECSQPLNLCRCFRHSNQFHSGDCKNTPSGSRNAYFYISILYVLHTRTQYYECTSIYKLLLFRAILIYFMFTGWHLRVLHILLFSR